MTLFQLFVTGTSLAGWRINRYSKKVFRTQAAAEAYVSDFVTLISESHEIAPLDRREPYEHKIVELELVDHAP
jgi:hypothetical protein